MITVGQCRAARALLGWTAEELAAKAHVGVATVRRYETGANIAERSLQQMVDALISGGAIFVAAGEVSDRGGSGVRTAAG